LQQDRTKGYQQDARINEYKYFKCKRLSMNEKTYILLRIQLKGTLSLKSIYNDLMSQRVDLNQAEIIERFRKIDKKTTINSIVVPRKSVR
jgi:hypothetical protein